MDESLPIVTAAVVCERVLVEKDEVVSAIRIFDRLFYAPPPPNIEPGQARIQFMFLVMLKRGNAKATHDVSIAIRSPNGKTSHYPGESPVRIEFAGDDPDAGANLQVQVALEPSEEGLHWIELNLDGRLSARAPLRVIRREGPPA